MSWSYNTSQTLDKDKVRFNIGDTDIDFQQITDEEISFFLNQGDSIVDTSIKIINNLIAKYSYKATQSVGKISVNYTNVVTNLQSMADRLGLENMSSSIYGGGISKSQKEVYQDDTDVVQPFFKRDTTDED